MVKSLDLNETHFLIDPLQYHKVSSLGFVGFCGTSSSRTRPFHVLTCHASVILDVVSINKNMFESRPGTYPLNASSNMYKLPVRIDFIFQLESVCLKDMVLVNH